MNKKFTSIKNSITSWFSKKAKANHAEPAVFTCQEMKNLIKAQKAAKRKYIETMDKKLRQIEDELFTMDLSRTNRATKDCRNSVLAILDDISIYVHQDEEWANSDID